MKGRVAQILNLLPEVKWDRWSGDLHSLDGICVYGWIQREDGKLDFILLRIECGEASMFATVDFKK